MFASGLFSGCRLVTSELLLLVTVTITNVHFFSLNLFDLQQKYFIYVCFWDLLDCTILIVYPLCISYIGGATFIRFLPMLHFLHPSFVIFDGNINLNLNYLIL